MPQPDVVGSSSLSIAEILAKLGTEPLPLMSARSRALASRAADNDLGHGGRCTAWRILGW